MCWLWWSKLLVFVVKLLYESYDTAPFKHIFNTLRIQGLFLDKLKIAQVTIIFKEGVTSEIFNYRPIFVFSCCFKIIECIIFNRSFENLIKIDLLYKKKRLWPVTLLKKSLWHRCFPVNFAKFLRTKFLQNTSGRLKVL